MQLVGVTQRAVRVIGYMKWRVSLLRVLSLSLLRIPGVSRYLFVPCQPISLHDVLLVGVPSEPLR